jgi:hypothetical protein
MPGQVISRREPDAFSPGKQTTYLRRTAHPWLDADNLLIAIGLFAAVRFAEITENDYIRRIRIFCESEEGE